jgi:hypothetical protein
VTCCIKLFLLQLLILWWSRWSRYVQYFTVRLEPPWVEPFRVFPEPWPQILRLGDKHTSLLTSYPLVFIDCGRKSFIVRAPIVRLTGCKILFRCYCQKEKSLYKSNQIFKKNLTIVLRKRYDNSPLTAKHQTKALWFTVAINYDKLRNCRKNCITSLVNIQPETVAAFPTLLEITTCQL